MTKATDGCNNSLTICRRRSAPLPAHVEGQHGCFAGTGSSDTCTWCIDFGKVLSSSLVLTDGSLATRTFDATGKFHTLVLGLRDLSDDGGWGDWI